MELGRLCKMADLEGLLGRVREAALQLGVSWLEQQLLGTLSPPAAPASEEGRSTQQLSPDIHSRS